MKEIKVVTWCDACGEDRIPADQSVTMSIGRTKPRTIDLCDMHHKELIVPVDYLLHAWGVGEESAPRPTAAQRGPRTIKPNPPCPDCGHQSPNRSALGTHTKNRHDKGLKDYPGL
jgi:hypothetical protein